MGGNDEFQLPRSISVRGKDQQSTSKMQSYVVTINQIISEYSGKRPENCTNKTDTASSQVEHSLHGGNLESRRKNHVCIMIGLGVQNPICIVQGQAISTLILIQFSVHWRHDHDLEACMNPVSIPLQHTSDAQNSSNPIHCTFLSNASPSALQTPFMPR